VIVPQLEVAAAPPFQSSNPEILSVEQAAQFLGMTKPQVWEMTRARGRARMPLPIPLIRINGNLRFRRSSLERWVDQLEIYERTGLLPREGLSNEKRIAF